jgi:hypothetical protein
VRQQCVAIRYGRGVLHSKAWDRDVCNIEEMHVGFLVGRHVSILAQVVSWSYLQGARESLKVCVMDVYSYSAMIGRRDVCVSDFIPGLLRT